MTSLQGDRDPIILPPMEGKLGRIAEVLTRVGDVDNALSEDAALDAITEILGLRRPSGDVYQKPLG